VLPSLLNRQSNDPKENTMTEQLDLDKLSNADIKKLWKETTARARNKAEQREITAQNEPTDEGYYRDSHGNIVEGKKPLPKTAGHYIDSSGYVQELAPGEKAPALSGNGLVDWLNQQNVASDPELKEALGETNLFFEGQITVGENEIVLTGKLERGGWVVDSRSQENPKLNLGFRLSRSLTKDEAVEQAVSYLESKAGPQFKTLSEDEERMIERMAVTNRLQAFVFYVQARLPENLANRFLELGAAGDDLGIQTFAAAAKVSEIIEEGVAHCFYWSCPRANESFFTFVRDNDDGRLWTFNLLDHLWTRYNLASSIDKLDSQAAPTAEDLDAMSDGEIERTLTEARKLRARNQIR
jgi:hypothetical protein